MHKYYFILHFSDDYHRLELEKKKNRVTKQRYHGPLIRYLSTTMPLIEELPPEAEINVDEDTDNNGEGGGG